VGVRFQTQAGKKRPWRADLCYNGRKIYCGSFESEEAAARAVDVKRIHFGAPHTSSLLNFPPNPKKRPPPPPLQEQPKKRMKVFTKEEMASLKEQVPNYTHRIVHWKALAKDHFPGRKPEVLKVKYNNMRWQERGLKMQGGQVFPSQSTPDLLQALDFLLKTQNWKELTRALPTLLARRFDKPEKDDRYLINIFKSLLEATNHMDDAAKVKDLLSKTNKYLDSNRPATKPLLEQTLFQQIIKSAIEGNLSRSVDICKKYTLKADFRRNPFLFGILGIIQRKLANESSGNTKERLFQDSATSLLSAHRLDPTNHVYLALLYYIRSSLTSESIRGRIEKAFARFSSKQAVPHPIGHKLHLRTVVENDSSNIERITRLCIQTLKSDPMDEFALAKLKEIDPHGLPYVWALTQRIERGEWTKADVWENLAFVLKNLQPESLLIGSKIIPDIKWWRQAYFRENGPLPTESIPFAKEVAMHLFGSIDFALKEIEPVVAGGLLSHRDEFKDMTVEPYAISEAGYSATSESDIDEEKSHWGQKKPKGSRVWYYRKVPDAKSKDQLKEFRLKDLSSFSKKKSIIVRPSGKRLLKKDYVNAVWKWLESKRNRKAIPKIPLLIKDEPVMVGKEEEIISKASSCSSSSDSSSDSEGESSPNESLTILPETDSETFADSELSD